jgi:large subunit ribosomal protein L10
MKKKADKQKEVEALRIELQKVEHLFVAGFNKLKVSQDFELRKTVRAAGGKYRVIKNNLAGKASEGTKAESLLQGLAGMTSLVYTDSDPVALAKALTAYAKINPTFTFKAGMVEGRAIEIKSIGDLANMPSKPELIARIMWLLNSSAQRLACALNGVGRNLAVVVEQAAKENKFSN